MQICMTSHTCAVWGRNNTEVENGKAVSKAGGRKMPQGWSKTHEIASVWDVEVQRSNYVSWLSLIIMCTWEMLRELNFRSSDHKYSSCVRRWLRALAWLQPAFCYAQQNMLLGSQNVYNFSIKKNAECFTAAQCHVWSSKDVNTDRKHSLWFVITFAASFSIKQNFVDVKSHFVLFEMYFLCLVYVWFKYFYIHSDLIVRDELWDNKETCLNYICLR